MMRARAQQLGDLLGRGVGEHGDSLALSVPWDTLV